MRTEFLDGSWINGDCMEELTLLPSSSVDLVLADLPYGTTACSWDSSLPLDVLWKEYWRVLKPGRAVVLTATQPFTSTLVMSAVSQFKHEWIWHKSKSGSAFTARYRPMAKHESVLVFGRGKVLYNPQMRTGEPYETTRRPPPINNHDLGLGTNGSSTTVNGGWRYPDSVIPFQQKWRRQDQLHPTQKPIELFKYLIETYSNEGDVVLDNTAGCGTTALAARRARRRFLCMERDAKFSSIAIQRLTPKEDAQ